MTMLERRSEALSFIPRSSSEAPTACLTWSHTVAKRPEIVAPIGIASRYRWFIRIGLVGYAATAIVAWAVQGPYYSTAYLAKGIEIALIALLVVDFVRFDGNPLAKVRREIAAGLAYIKTRRTAPAAA